jgi:hypothetical protein
MPTAANTCFGQSFGTLVRLPGPIRGSSAEGTDTQRPEKADMLSCPRELMRLIEWLMTSGIEEVGVFLPVVQTP